MNLFTPLELFSGRLSGLNAPYSDSVVIDPDLLARYAKNLSIQEYEQSKSQYDFAELVVNRNRIKGPRILYYRKEANRIYGRVLLAVLQALMIGRIRFKAKPDDDYSDLAAETYTKIYMRYFHPLVQTAIEDYFVCGVGGIAITPLGTYPLRPENTSAFPSFFSPRLTIRTFALEWEDAKDIFNHPALKKEPPIIGVKPEERINKTDPRSLHTLPTVILIEVMYPDKIEYHYGPIKVGEIQRKGSWGHYLLVGNTRTIDEYNLYDPQDPTETEHTWIAERSTNYNELPVGLIEMLTCTPHKGYNLLEAHEKLVEHILVRSTRASTCAVRADLLNLSDPNTRAFLNYYKPIATMGGETAAAAISFVDTVAIPEIQAGLREIENQITAITGITPYMMGLSGVSDVASEIVMMQSQANARINHIHSIITTWLGDFIDKTTQYLIAIPPENQTPLMAYNAQTNERVVIGGLRPESTQIAHVDYATLFSRYAIEPTLVGELTNINRRTELMQALQLIMQVLPILAQLGQIYDIKQISDHVLQTFNIDPSRITMQLQAQQQPTPDAMPAQQTPTTPTETPTPTEEEPAPNPAEPTATQTTTQAQPTNIEEVLASLLSGGMP